MRAYNEAELSKLEDRITPMLPAMGGSFQTRFWSAAISLVRRPDLAECTQESLVMSVVNCARLGLIPDNGLGQVWVLPYRDKGQQVAQVQVGVKGRQTLARRSGDVTVIRTQWVYKNDHFDYQDGLEQVCIHRPWQLENKKEPGDLFCTYVVAHFTGGDRDIKIAWRDDIKRSMDRSKAAKKGFGPWISNHDEMALNVPIRMAWKNWPQTEEMVHADRLDDAADSEQRQSTPMEYAALTGSEAIPEPPAKDNPDEGQ